MVELDLKIVSEDNLYTPDIAFAEEEVKSKINNLSSKDK
jgi:hypothetical protein